MSPANAAAAGPPPESRRAASGAGARLTRDTIVYGIGGSATRLANALFLPVFTRILSTDEYGALDVLASLVSILTVLALAGVNSAVFYHYHRADESEARRRIVGTALVITTLLASILCVLGLLVAPAAAELILGDRRYTLAVALNFAWLPVNVVVSIGLDLLRLGFRPWAYSVLGLVRTLLAALTGVALAGWAGLGLDGVLLSQLLFGAGAAAAALWLARAMWRPALDAPAARALLAFGLPLVPMGIAYWVLTFSDRYFLVEFRSLSEVGLYAVANKIGGQLQLATFAFQTAWWPFAFAHAAEPSHRQLFARVFRVVTLVLGLLTVALGLFAREALLVLVPAPYVGAYAFIGMLAASLAIHGVYQVISSGARFTGGTVHMAWTSACAAGVNLLLNVALIPRLGLLGAAASTLVAFAVSTALLFVVAERAYPIGYEWRLAVAVSACVGIALGAGLALDASVAPTAWNPAVTLAKLAILGASAAAAARALGLSVATLSAQSRLLLPRWNQG